ncbi:MAG TPA: ATP-dependent DNA ligase [Bryobacteraceae bacterium]|jgi:DNA ligase-1|nr:ATP-dependent DNA ligase [Bryobacteraceae bacterium]
MLLANVVQTSGRVAATSKRLAKVEYLADLLKQLDPDEIEIVVSFLSGETRQGRKGIGYAVVRDAEVSPAANATLQIRDVDRMLASLAAIKGAGSEQRKRGELRSLLAQATADEQQFLKELLLGGLRQGALEGIMFEALAKASGVGADRIRRAAMMAGNTALVARSVLESGEASLEAWSIRLFQPVHPMLAQPAANVESALEQMGEAAFEYKLDGARVQVHKSGDEVRVYTRALNDVTSSTPEVVEAARALPARDLILDGEVISFAPDGRPQPFQVTMRRFGRKTELDRLRAELPLTPVWFDILYRDGQPLIDHPQADRFDILRGISPTGNLVTHMTTPDAGRAADFLSASLASGNEGVMAKDPGSAYMAGARGSSWLKIKKAHTLDLVILAAEWGNGRRKGWLSNLHLGARDTVTGGYAMLGKTFKGMTDEMLRWQTEQLLSLEISRDNYTVFVEPKIVVEIAYSDIQISPRYESGLALRFARVKRYRTDKTAAEADTFETVKQLAGFSRSN